MIHCRLIEWDNSLKQISCTVQFLPSYSFLHMDQSGAIYFKREQVYDFFKEIESLIQIHHDEVAHDKDIELDPDWDMYRKLEETGYMRSFTARFESRSLIGYCLFFVNSDMHNKNSIQAHQDILFIHPTYRGFGHKFIEWCDQQLKQDGVQVVYHHTKEKHNFGGMLETLGYQLCEHIYSRRLDHG
jgi:GNAT superfamily N-acetyltransferase